MEDLFIKGTVKDPEVLFKTDGSFSIKGRSLNEWPTFFYEIYEWLEEFLILPKNDIELTINLVYLNTSSIALTQKLFTIFEKFDKVNIVWHIDRLDESMVELYNILEELHTKINFKLIKYTNIYEK